MTRASYRLRASLALAALGHGVAMRRRVGNEDECPGRGGVVLLVDREPRLPGGDEVELLVGQLRVLGVRLDHILARLAGRVGVAPEGAYAKRQPYGAPDESPWPGNGFNLVELNEIGAGSPDHHEQTERHSWSRF